MLRTKQRESAPTPALEMIPYESQQQAPGRIRIVVDGITPLLTHNPAGMSTSAKAGEAKRGSRIPEAAAEAEAGAYRLEDGTCAIKGESFVGCITGKQGAAGAWKTKNRGTMKSRLAHITCVETLVPLVYPNGELIRDYAIDIQPVIVVKARIMRARPRYDQWSATFTIQFDPQLVGDAKLIVDIAHDGGNRIGVGDYRPRYGRFKVRQYALI